MTTERVTLEIDGLRSGDGGALLVERALSEQPGVVWAYVNRATEMAYIEFHPALVDAQRFGAIVNRLGLRAGQARPR